LPSRNEFPDPVIGRKDRYDAIDDCSDKVLEARRENCVEDEREDWADDRHDNRKDNREDRYEDRKDRWK